MPLENLDDIIEFSPHWDKLVQEHIPVEAFITDIGFRIGLHYFVGHDSLPKYRIKAIHSRVLDEPLPDLKSPEELLVLDFPTHTELTTYKHFILNAKNLKELYFGYSSLTTHLLSSVDVPLTKLTLLYMADRPVEGKYKDPEKLEILPRNIIGFLDKTLPSIQKIVVCTVASRKQTLEYGKALLKFIQRHSGTLKVVKFTVDTTIHNFELDEPVDDLVEYSSNSEEFNLAQLANVKLTEIDIRFGRNFFCGLEQWRGILENQKELEHLTIAVEKPIKPKIFEAPVTLSAVNLLSVQIGVLVYDGLETNSLDCSIFADCVNLKLLVFNGPTVSRPASREIFNLSKLPTSLYAFAVENIYVETREIAEFTRGVMLKLRTLEKLGLQNIGTTTGYGVTLAMLDCWITARVLQEIIIKHGMNGDESRLPECDHLLQFGIKSPIGKCNVHAFYYPRFGEYKMPSVSDEIPDQ